MKRGVALLLGFLLISTIASSVPSQAHQQNGSDYFASFVPLQMQDGSTHFLKDINLSYRLVPGQNSQEIQFDRGLESCDQPGSPDAGTTTEPISFQFRPLDDSHNPLSGWETYVTYSVLDPWWGCQLQIYPSLGGDGQYMYHDDFYRRTRLAPNLEMRAFGEQTGTEYADAIQGLRGRDPINYVAMGDSYSSGESVEPYFSDSATPNLSPIVNRCHRSQRAYSQLLHAPFSSSPLIDSALSVHFIACSGARTYNVLPSGSGQYDEPPQLAQGFVNDRTNLVTVTIGGNDVGFKGALIACSVVPCIAPWIPAPSLNPVESLSSWISDTVQSQDFLDQLTLTLHAIRYDAPNATIVVSGYPTIFPVSRDDQLGCAKLAPLVDAESFLNGIGYQLNNVVQEAARRAGVYYNDRVQNAFDGHSICGGSGEWINGYTAPEITLGQSFPFVGLAAASSFHPNAAGQAGYAVSIEDFLTRQIDGGARLSTSGLPINPDPTLDSYQTLRARITSLHHRHRHRRAFTAASDTPDLSGSLGEASLSPASPIAQGCSDLLLGPGEVAHLEASGFAPNSTVNAVLYEHDGSHSGIQLGSIPVDQGGNVSGNLQMPLNLSVPNSDLVMLKGADARAGGRLAFANVGVLSPAGQCDENLPIVSMTAPSSGATYVVGQPVSARYECRDDSAASGLASCSGTSANGQLLDTSSPGQHTFEVTARDNLGNTTKRVINYSVVYSFTGFTAPVNNLPIVNVAQAGQTIPITWTIRDYAGAGISDSSSFLQVSSATVPCDSADITDEVEWTTASTGLKYLGGGTWRYNWQTSKSYAGSCRTLRLKLSDGVAEGRSASFRFKA